MIGYTYIDGFDIFEKYGVFVAKGAYADLVNYPALKEPDKNDWHEENGIEVDLSDPKLDTRSFDMSFGAVDYFNAGLFIEKLAEGAYHDFRFEEIGITRKLRLVSYPNKKIFKKLTTFTLKFADDFPLDGFVSDIPPITNKFSKVEIDNNDLLNSYSVYVLEGVLEEINKTPDVKQNLLVNVKTGNGASYHDDMQRQRFQAKQINLKCLLTQKVNDNGRYWYQDYYNLLNDLVRPGERALYEDFNFNTIPCYYHSSKVDKLEIINDKLWCEFTLSLMLTDYDVEVYFLLSTQDGKLITTQDGINTINLREEWV